MTNIKRLRDKRGMTQDELAAHLNVSRSTVAMWETNKNIPPTKILLKLAAALGCTIDDLLKETEDTE